MTCSHRVPSERLWAVTVSQTFLSLRTLTVWRWSQAFFRTPLREDHRGEGPFSPRPVQGACRHVTSMVDADRGRPAQASLAGVSTMLPPPPTVLWEEVAVPTPDPRRGCSPPLRTGQLQSHMDPPGFLLCHLFMSGWPRGYLFILCFGP